MSDLAGRRMLFPRHTEEVSQLSPEPAADPSALRAAVRDLAPASLTTFDSQYRIAQDLAAHGRDTEPVLMFLRRWGVFVERRRCPTRAARLDRLELVAAQATNLRAARAAAQEIARILSQSPLRP
ncbi:hypothetical protein GCM10028793_26450 [Nocardiopsis oceani]